MADVNGYNSLKGKKRLLSSFLAEEMMYDYVTGALDADRKSAVEEFLKTSEEARELESHFENALNYCSELSETQVSEPLMEKLLNSRSVFNRFIEIIAWNKWPEATRWTIEAFAVSLVVAFVIALSWPRISKWFPERQRDVVLAELEKSKQKIETEERLVNKLEANEKMSEEATDVIEAMQKTSETKTNLSSEDESTDAIQGTPEQEGAMPTVAKIDTIETPKEKTQDTKAGAKNESSEKETEASPAVVVASKQAFEKPMPKGFLYRAFMTLGNIDEVTEGIRLGLIDLGGQKAGEVKMGWRKAEGSYFHFSIPEANYDAAVKMLRSFGPVQIARDPHWRVMPEGQIRIILTVKDKDLKNQNP